MVTSTTCTPSPLMGEGQGGGDCTVTFLENGFTRTKSAAEFRAQWFGVGLVSESALSDPSLSAIRSTLSAKVLKTQELLHIKGAGWFKKLWKKIKKFFQKVVQAVAKALQKIIQWVTKALTTVFGKTIGRALSSLVLGPIPFFANTAHYMGQGDWKGLFKYWGQMAIQLAIQAVLFFLPGVGQVFGAIFQILGNFIQAVGAAFIQFAVQSLGQGLLSTLVHSAGSFLIRAGANLTGLGLRLASSAGSFLKELKTKGFSLVTDSIKKSFGNFLNQINPITQYKSILKSVTDAATKSVSSFSKLLTDVAEKLSVQLAIQKVDQVLEKSKMNSFVKSILSTVSSAGIQAIGSAIFNQSEISPEGGPATSSGGRSPPTGEPGFLERIKGALSSASGLITSALKDSAGFIKSIFIQESNSLSPVFEDLVQEYSTELGFDSEGNPIFYKPLGLNASIEYRPELQEGEYSFFDLDEGLRQILRIDPETKEVLSSEQVGNLPFIDSIGSAWQAWSDLVTTDPTLQSIGGYTVGFTEALINAPQAIAQTPQALWQLMTHPIASAQAIQANLEHTYQTIMTGGTNPYESARAIGGIFGGIEVDIATGAGLKSIGAKLSTLPKPEGIFSRLANVLADERGFARIGRASTSKFGSEDLLYGIYNQRLDDVQRLRGGVMLRDIVREKFGHSKYLPPGMNIVDYSKYILDEAASTGRIVRFDITDVKNVKGVLKGTHYPNAITSQEFRYVYSNWDRFKKVVKFYKNGKEIEPL